MSGKVKNGNTFCPKNFEEVNVNRLQTEKCPDKSISDLKEKNKSILSRKFPLCIWDKKIPDTQIEKFKKFVEEKHSKKFDSYWDLHRWSVESFAQFWEDVWIYVGVIASKPYEEVYRKTGEGFLDCEWFPGATLNFAENVLRIKDDRIAFICVEESGKNEEFVTFAEMYEEVKLYSAAFRKHGLKKGDVVACYMSNRKEAIYACLAATSIGAIFGGPHPYVGPGPATSIINKMESKFLIAVDYHAECERVYPNFEYLPEISISVPSLEKVIILATKPETKSKDISNIRNGCLLEDFLEIGRNPDGTVPDIIFEQLPFSHPVAISFSSGTTGLPKGPVHSIAAYITHLINVVFYSNLKSGDVIFMPYPVGWSLWDTFIPALSWGVTLVLYLGSPLHQRPDGSNIWDVFAKYKVKYSFLATMIVDKLEKLKAYPKPESNLEHLESVAMGGSPVKPQNCLYLLNKVKKDLFVLSNYGASETFGTFSGYDLNLPSYAGEIQVPCLGMDIRCFDDEGNSVIDKRGDMVVATPSPTLPVYIWKDEGNKILTETYLTKYPGVWCQNDEIWINSLTKGMIVIGRTDDTLIQNGDRFGAGDIYFGIHEIEDIQDSICVGQTRDDGECRAALFVKMKPGFSFTQELIDRITKQITKELWFDCVPEVMLEVKDIPYNLNNKKMESVVRRIIATNEIPKVNNIRNPECLKYYCGIPELANFYKI